MRWKYPGTEENDPEARARSEIRARIDLWWQSFSERTHDLQRVFDNEAQWDLAGWMATHLPALDPHLAWEFGPGTGKDKRLVITPEREFRLRPLVDEILARAPSLPGWSFSGYRTPEPVGQMARTLSARTGQQPAFTGVGIAPGELNRIDLAFQFPGAFLGRHRRIAHAQAILAAEALLGEDLMIDWLGRLDAPAEVTSPVPPAALARTFAALAGSQRARLPSTPVMHFVDTLSRAAIEMAPKAADDYAHRFDLREAHTVMPDVWRNAHSDQPFSSTRFSRLGETFCYVKIDRRESSERIDPAHDARLLQSLDAMLRRRCCGCVIGGGTGLRYAYADLALLDMDEAVRGLRAVLQNARVSHRAWIQFFDGTLAAEWIGVWPDSPPPLLPASG